MNLNSLSKNDGEHAVPEDWRPIFRQIANVLASSVHRLCEQPIDGMTAIDDDLADFIQGSIEGYGDELVDLDDSTWERSIYRWIGDHWLFVVDLSTAREPVSDLALHARVREASGLLTLDSVHVP